MGPYKRNWFVGGTVLLGLVTLGILIILFGGSLGNLFAGEKIAIHFKSDRADGISDGSIIRYLGQQVGTVKGVQLQTDEAPNYVLVWAELNKDLPIPRAVHGSIRVLSPLGGSALIELEVEPNTDIAPKLAGGEVLSLKYVGSGVIPPAALELVEKLNVAADRFNRTDVIGDIKVAINNFNAQVTKAGEVMTSINAVLGDEATQKDLRAAIADFTQASAHLKVTLANAERISDELKALPAKIDATIGQAQEGVGETRAAIKDAHARILLLSDNLDRNLAKLADALDLAKRIGTKIDSGDGTAALLLNDPKLYEKLVTGVEVINETVRDIQRVIRGFEEDGVPLNLR